MRGYLYLLLSSYRPYQVIGTVLGLLSGYFERIVFFLMRIVDVFLAIPRLLLVIVIAEFMRPSIWNLIVIFIILDWPITTRVIRSAKLPLRHWNYVEAAKMIGAKDATY